MLRAGLTAARDRFLRGVGGGLLRRRGGGHTDGGLFSDIVVYCCPDVIQLEADQAQIKLKA